MFFFQIEILEQETQLNREHMKELEEEVLLENIMNYFWKCYFATLQCTIFKCTHEGYKIIWFDSKIFIFTMHSKKYRLEQNKQWRLFCLMFFFVKYFPWFHIIQVASKFCDLILGIYIYDKDFFLYVKVTNIFDSFECFHGNLF